MPGDAKEVVLSGGGQQDVVKLLGAILYALCVIAEITVEDALTAGNRRG